MLDPSFRCSCEQEAGGMRKEDPKGCRGTGCQCGGWYLVLALLTHTCLSAALGFFNIPSS